MREIFEDIDSLKERNTSNLSEYNVRMSSLEEVFNKIGENEFKGTNDFAEEANKIDDPQLLSLIEGNQPVRENMSTGDSVKALLKLFFLISRKSRYLIRVIFGVAFPTIFVKLITKYNDLQAYNYSDVGSVYNRTSGKEWFSIGVATPTEPLFGNQFMTLENLLKKPIYAQEPNNKVIQTMNAPFTPIKDGDPKLKSFKNFKAFNEFLEKNKQQLTIGSIGNTTREVIDSAIMLGPQINDG